MRNRFLPLGASFTLLFVLYTSALAASTDQSVPSLPPDLTSMLTLAPFPASAPYTDGQFTDVLPNDWFAPGVKSAYTMGLMKGSSETTFSPLGNLSLGEMVALASRLYSLYYEDGQTFSGGDPWYEPYISYAKAQNIYPMLISDYTAPANHAYFAAFLAAALPPEALPAINTVVDGALPDVQMSDVWGSATYQLYRAGILTGSDAYGTFNPFTPIQRAEAATIITRMVVPEQRKTVSLPSPFQGYTTWEYGGYETYAPYREFDYELLNGQRSGNVRYTGQYKTFTAPIRILEQPQCYTDYADGVGFNLRWSNQRDQDIKYIHFYVTPYNRVWDPVRCNIQNISMMECYSIGPYSKVNANTVWADDDYMIHNGDEWTNVGSSGDYAKGKSELSSSYSTPLSTAQYHGVVYDHYWDTIWYNGDISYAIIDKVLIEYQDGSSITLKGDKLAACFY